jgi:hypothetical protein
MTDTAATGDKNLLTAIRHFEYAEQLTIGLTFDRSSL